MSTTTIPDLPPFASEPTARDRHFADAQKYFPAESPSAATAAASSPSLPVPSSPRPAAATPVRSALGALSALTSVRPAASAPAPTTDTASPALPIPASPRPSDSAPATPALDDVARDLAPPDEKSKSFTGWKELKSRAQGYAEKAAALERELAAARSGDATTPADAAARARLAELETQNRELSTRLSAADLRTHPGFIAKFVMPQQAAAAKLAAIAKTEDAPVDVDRLLALSGRAFNVAVGEALDTLSPHGRVRFQAQLDTLLAAREGAEQALAQSGEALKTLSAHGGARARGAFDAVGQKYSGAYTPMPVDDTAPDEARAAAAAYNADLAAVAQHAERYAFGAIDETLAAELAHKAALFDFTVARGIPRIGQLYEAELSQLTTRNAELESQVRALTAASPAITSGAGTPTASGQPHESHLEAARRYFAQG